MISELEIRNFRGLRHVRLTGLKRVNLIVGGNDTGKTSILEALVLLLGDGKALRNLPITFRTNQSGGLFRSDPSGQSINDQHDREIFWSWLFYDRSTDNEIGINGKLIPQGTIAVKTERLPDPHLGHDKLEPVLTRTDSRETEARVRRPGMPQGQDRLLQMGVKFSVMENNPPSDFRLAVLSTRAPDPVQDAENYNQVALLAEGERRIEEIMREIEPRVRRLRYAKLPGTHAPLIFVDVGLSRAVPATQMGQAFNRILHIYTHIMANRATVLLVDEIENGIFSESMPKIWKGLLALCEREGIQIFATTHSRECVMAAHAAAEERNKDELSVQRLQVVKGNVEAVPLGEKHLEMAAEMGLEVRS